MRFAYTRTGGPLLNWSGPTPPSPSRAGETRSLGDLDVPRPGSPEIVDGYESPQPGAAIIHLGHDCKTTMQGYMPEGAARSYGQAAIGETPAPKQFDMALVRKASVLAAAYHGVRRNNGSVLWGLLWGLAAYIAPLRGLSMVAIAGAQGFAQPKPKSNPASALRKWRRLGSAKKPRKYGLVRRKLAAKKGWQKRRRKAGWRTADMKRGYKR